MVGRGGRDKALCSHLTNSTQFKNLCSHLCLNAISVIRKKGISILAHAVSYRMSSVKATSSLSKKKKQTERNDFSDVPHLTT